MKHDTKFLKLKLIISYQKFIMSRNKLDDLILLLTKKC